MAGYSIGRSDCHALTRGDTDVRRRRLLKIALFVTVATEFLWQGASALPAETVRDRLWIWGRPAGTYNESHFRKTEFRSAIEPVAGAQQMGIPNVIFICADHIKPPTSG